MGTPNEEMIAYWNGPGGEGWASNVDDQDRELQELGDAALDALAPVPSESVLDVGCGPGTTTLMLAEAVGARGRVVGVDVSAPLLAVARRRAAGVANVMFVEGDAQTMAPPGAPFDAVFSRFGLSNRRLPSPTCITPCPGRDGWRSCAGRRRPPIHGSWRR